MQACRTFVFLLLASTVALAAPPDRIASAIDSSQTVELARSLHPKAQPEYDQGPMDPQTRLSYVTLLTAPSASQQRALDKLLADQQDPASPLYHQWLTPEQYADRFGLSPNDISKIIAWLKAQGFTVLSVGGGRNSIVFSGTVAQIESAFQTQIHRYNVDGEMHFANSTSAKVPAAFSGVITGVRGLHDFRPKPMGIRKPLRPLYYDSKQKLQYFAPGDIKTIYDLAPLYNQGIDGTGQTLAVIGQTDVYLADLNFFRSAFGLPAITGCTTNANNTISACSGGNFGYVVAGPGPDPGVPFAGDLSESDLDLEWSSAVARGAKIIFVTAPSQTGTVFDALSAAINPPTGPPVAPVITLSYGNCELMFGPFLETELQQANAEGVTILNSSGDMSSAGCDNFTNATTPPNLATRGLAVSYPASSPEVTGVGGTAVPIADLSSSQFWGTTNGTDGGSALGYVPEVAWNDPYEFGTFCAANLTNLGCTQGGSTPVPGWIPVTGPLTAQEDIGLGGGGGGVSNCFTINGGQCTAGFPKPSWQPTLTLTNGGQQLAVARYEPDVSLESSPNFEGYIFCTPLSELIQGSTSSTSSCASGIPTAIETNRSILGGTSAAAPIFAGMVALLNQYFQGTSSNGLGNINPMLYQLAAVPGNTAFHQITDAASNSVVACQGGTPASQPLALQCPGAAGSVSSMGFQASTKDTATGYNVVTGLGSVDVNNLVQAWAASRSASSIGLAGAPTSVTVGQSVTLTATVTPSKAIGSVAFYKNRTTALGTTPLTSASNGVATFTWTPTGSDVGTDIISASYSGDGYNASADTGVAGAVTVTVTAPTFTFASTGAASHTVLAGQTSLAYSFTATPTSSTTFEGNVTLSCSAFAPTNPTLTASSCTFAPSAMIAAGSGLTTVTMTIATAGPNTGMGTAIRPRADKRSPRLPLALPIAGVVMVGLGRKVAKHSVPAGLCVSLVLLGLLIACGGGSTPPVSVTVTPGTASLWPNNTGWPSQTQTFSASVANTANTAVTWSASSGSIDASGKYTAPTIAAGLPSSATITATSQASSSATGTATVTLKPATVPGTYTVTVTATEGPTTPTPLPTVTLVVQ